MWCWPPAATREHYEKGKLITGLVNGQLPGESDAVVYHAGTALREG